MVSFYGAIQVQAVYGRGVSCMLFWAMIEWKDGDHNIGGREGTKSECAYNRYDAHVTCIKAADCSSQLE